MRLRNLKRKGLTDNTAQLLADMLQERESLAFEVLTILMSAKKECNTSADKIKLANAMSQVMNSVHGLYKPAPILLAQQTNNLSSVTININPTLDGNKLESKPKTIRSLQDTE